MTESRIDPIMGVGSDFQNTQEAVEMNETRVFVSYSRQQLYFTESLALNLEAKGIPTWLDIQQLEPGVDWEQRIHTGLENCTALILVASRSALASPYVRDEWTAALAADKPVYVVMFEAVKLPEALTANPKVAFFNFRYTFNRQLNRVVECIRDGKVQRDSLATWRYAGASAPVLVVLASLVLPSLILLLWLIAIVAPGIYIPREFDGYTRREMLGSALVVIAWGMMLGVGLHYAWAFSRRRFDAFTLQVITVFLVVILWFAYRSLFGITHGQYLFRVSNDGVPLNTDDYPDCQLESFMQHPLEWELADNHPARERHERHLYCNDVCGDR